MLRRQPASTTVVLGHLMENIGSTYLVTHKVTKEQFACKSIASRKLVNKDVIEDVRRQVQIVHHLTGHYNIMEFKGAYEDRHSVNLVIELCAGGELFDWIIAKGHNSERSPAALCRQILTVVHNCLSMGVMHKDFNPESFLLLSTDEDSLLKATDFGFSMFLKLGGDDVSLDTTFLLSPEGSIKDMAAAHEMASEILSTLNQGGEENSKERVGEIFEELTLASGDHEIKNCTENSPTSLHATLIIAPSMHVGISSGFAS
ncbi:hypothetical protein F0562_003324 [Nyssa sinensis]|uniref:Protein kinase domain-containing protein n=1 Tax=Nyssa sinensis TaxID=561372 RepID=A0A5J5BV34_9ASTE|nr:hypothetical protein F0562_003324 [Nyssa sinensis]